MSDYLQDQYNMEDPGFVSIVDDLSLWSAPFGMRLLDTVHYLKNIRALDIGFGLGFPLIELAMRLGPSSRVFGIDPWKAGIERTKLKLNYTGVHNVELIEGVAEEMPFENNFFDLIVSNNGMNNVRDLSKTLSECNRVSRIGTQLVFTFNTDRTFLKFYDLYRRELRENGLQEYETNLDAHIYLKRKPLSEFKDALRTSGFRITAICTDEFNYHFSDGTALLNHFFMRVAFMNAWKEVLPENRRQGIFQQIENKINRIAEKNRGFSMNVPFVTMDCEKIKQRH